MRVEGYLVARDRALQLELLRRTAEGRMAEVLGASAPNLVAQDSVLRHAGLARVARAEYEAMADGEPRRILDAYADGVSQVFKKIRAGEIKLPAHLLSHDVNADLYFQQVLDGARKTFSSGDPDPQLAERAGIERDLWRFAPADPAATTTGYPVAGSKLELPDGTPMYLHCSFDIGFREGRLQKLLDEHKDPLSTEDLAAIQGDVRSPVGAALVPSLLAAIDRAEQERRPPRRLRLVRSQRRR